MLTELTSEFTHFNPVIRIKGNNQPYFGSHNVDRCVEQRAAVPGLIPFVIYAAVSCKDLLLFS